MNTGSYINKVLSEYPRDKKYILDIFRELKEESGELKPHLQSIAKHMGLPNAEVEGIASFYSFLSLNKEGDYIIRVCSTISCDLQNKDRLIEILSKETGAKLGETSKDGLFTLKTCNCLGMCDQGPALLINGKLVPNVDEKKAKELISNCREGKLNKKYKNNYNSNIYKKSHLYNFLVNETSYKYLEMQPKDILNKIKESKLRGRGGAGYPTGLKWELAMKAEKQPKYIICNADEGEPGTFKDRFILDNFPEKVIEGMNIAGKVLNTSSGIIYLRGEYEYLKNKIAMAIEKFPMEIGIHIGAGSYVCGEETALIESIEGNRGEPRVKPPYPVTSGFKNQPTVVNNVETFVEAALIIERGVDYFTELGTNESEGTKFFSISGDLDKPGIYEIPFGTNLNEVIKMCKAKDITSIQVGGASGRNIHYKDFDKTLAFEAIPSGGSIILFNSKRDLLNVAKNFVEFFQDESCGQCTSCRVGTTKILEGIENIIHGYNSMSYIKSLIALGNSVMASSKCGLGQDCAKAFNSIMENWYL